MEQRRAEKHNFPVNFKGEHAKNIKQKTCEEKLTLFIQKLKHSRNVVGKQISFNFLEG